MGIKHETIEKVKNLEKLTEEEKKEVLEDTQRAGFSPAIHQVRAIFDLTDAIKSLDNKSTELSEKIYILTWVIGILTLVTTIITVVTFINFFK